MKKLIWSTFAVSLMVLPATAKELSFDDLTQLENELLPELQGHQRFTSPELHAAQPDWQVKPEDVIKDKEPLKGQTYSLIPWSTQDPQDWLNVEQWIVENDIKSKNPDWLLRLRDDRQLELFGKVLSCYGKCPIYRGTMPAQGQHLSRLVEGDELRTGTNSVAWVYLVDGTLIRLGSESSLSFQEINLSKTEHFLLVRLNKGHVFWHPRPKGELAVDLGPETDAVSLPLRLLEANQQYFERQIFNSQKDLFQLAEVLDLNDNAVKAQVKHLNELRAENDKNLTIPSKVMFVTPNITMVATQMTFDMIYIPGGKSYLKKRAADEISLQLRGYNQTDVVTLSETNWFEIDTTGRSYTKIEDVPAHLQLMELLTKRIRTLELAREIWAKSVTLPIMNALGDPKVLAFEYGYSLWGDESKKRFEYLTEYTRRVETTNIKSLDNLLTKIQDSGSKVDRELHPGLYQFAVNYYLKGLKTRYTDKKMQVREMNDLQYYVWTLKHGTL